VGSGPDAEVTARQWLHAGRGRPGACGLPLAGAEDIHNLVDLDGREESERGRPQGGLERRGRQGKWGRGEALCADGDTCVVARLAVGRVPGRDVSRALWTCGGKEAGREPPGASPAPARLGGFGPGPPCDARARVEEREG
jgi:hypothetical protein